MKEIINAQRIAFITKAMSLSSDEAQKLWPIMNVAEEKRENLKKERNLIRKKIELLQSTAANSDYEELINIEASFYTKEAVIFNERQQ
ncbi:MAG: hypothetical protein ACK452_04085, partial [Bacteroidota bacterium]